MQTRIRTNQWDSPKLCLLWTANETDAVFDETAISQPMKYIHHLVMPSDKRLINSGRLQDVQVECSHDIGPAFSIWDLLNVVASEHHAQRAPREVVSNRFPHATNRHVKVADGVRRFAMEIARAIATIELVALSDRKPADGIDLCCAIRTVTDVDLRQAKGGTLRHWFIEARQQDAERVAESTACI